MEKTKLSSSSDQMKIDVHCHMFNHKIASIPILLHMIEDIMEPKGVATRAGVNAVPSRASRPRKKMLKLLFMLFFKGKEALLKYAQENGEMNTIFTPLMFDLKYAVDSEIGVKTLREMSNTLKKELKPEPSIRRNSVGSSDEMSPSMDEFNELFAGIDEFIDEREEEINRASGVPSISRSSIKFRKDTFDEQYDQLLEIKNKNKDIIKPFFVVDSRRPDVYKRMIKALEVDGFVGVKMYCPNGYSPLDPRLDEVYKYCIKNNVPITAHCSYGGFATLENVVDVRGYVYQEGGIVEYNTTLRFKKKITNKGGVEERAKALNHPDLWKKVLEDYKGLKLNLAHMGIRKSDDSEKRYDWSNLIVNMMLEHQSLYTDLSCMVEKDAIITLWKLASDADKKSTFKPGELTVTDRIMFGTDLWLSMLSKDLHTYMNDFEDAFKGKQPDLDRIQKTNPRRFLNL